MKNFIFHKLYSLKIPVCFLFFQLLYFDTLSQSLAVNTTGATANASAMLDITSSNKGLLIPRISLSSINDVATIPAPATSLLVYNSNAAITGGSGLGYYYFDGTKWVKVIDASTALNTWNMTGNTGTTAGTNFIGTTDNVGLVFKVKGFQAGYLDVVNLNTSIGERTLFANTSGTRNAAFGYYSLFSNTTGFDNTAVGYRALYNNTAFSNTAIGSDAMFSNTSGQENIAIGYRALYQNSGGVSNAAAGTFSMYSNTLGSGNAAFGNASLFTNTTGSENTALGDLAMYANTTGEWNTALGSNALGANTTGRENTATGISSLTSNTTGNNNTCSGSNALFTNSTGSLNTVMGWTTMHNNTTGSGNTAIGASAAYSNTTGGSNTALGISALRTNMLGNDNTGLGAAALFSNTGDNNTGTGSNALNKNTSGTNNVAMGFGCLYNNTSGIQNTAMGALAGFSNSTGTDNTAVGYSAGPSAGALSNTTSIGSGASCAASNTVRIGNASVTSIGGYQNWTNVSDGRFKENVQENVPGLNFINQLRPVTYQLNRYKLNEFTGVDEKREQFPGQAVSLPVDKYSAITTGFIAQEVEVAAKRSGFEFSGIDKPKNDKDFYGLRYAEFVVPLVKGMQEQQQMIEEQNKRIAVLERQVQEMREKVK